MQQHAGHPHGISYLRLSLVGTCQPAGRAEAVDAMALRLTRWLCLLLVALLVAVPALGRGSGSRTAAVDEPATSTASRRPATASICSAGGDPSRC